mmetsp:Transcript_2/g.4  ORF Transcript_2/g.4 Transcript_2/m.4 type:complete len:379 (+) Transcript_2:77-1213(+)
MKEEDALTKSREEEDQDFKTFSEEQLNTRSFSKQEWFAELSPRSAFSFKPLISALPSMLELNQATLEFDEAIVQAYEERLKSKEDAPEHVKKYAKKEEKKPYGCVLQVVLGGSNQPKRKFVIASFIGERRVLPLNLFFDTKELLNLRFEIKGRTHVEKAPCRIRLSGVIHLPLPSIPASYIELALENGEPERIAYRKEVAAQESIDRANKATTIYDYLKKKESKRHVETKEDSFSEEDHTGPVSYIRDNISILEIVRGYGRKIRKGDRVMMHFKGKLNPSKHRCFDKTSTRNPFEFTVGSKKVIKGINLGIVGMTINGRRELIIPPELGFGSKGIRDQIPPNATLFYDIQIVEFQPAKKYRRAKAVEQKRKKKNKITK